LGDAELLGDVAAVTYSITEVFYTLQGEGYHAGTPALFVRFAGCSMWSGIEEHRERDATRNAAACPLFCDTDFRPRERLTAAEIVERGRALAPAALPLIVLTGGEPLLQVDHPLVDALRISWPHAVIAVETNGAHEPRAELDWICVSPKVAPSSLQLRQGDEIKVVVPAYAPEDYAAVSAGFTHRWVSAEAKQTGVGRSLIIEDNLRRAAEWIMQNPGWRLTVQTHRIIGIP
jgi:7-carboxy-7-deazaguanine synthase